MTKEQKEANEYWDNWEKKLEEEAVDEFFAPMTLEDGTRLAPTDPRYEEIMWADYYMSRSPNFREEYDKLNDD